MAQRNALWLAPFAVLASCGPIPVDQAERVCLRDAELAQRPRGSVAVGAASGSGGTHGFGRVELEIGSDYLMGRDPSAVFDRCVRRRSGQMPERALQDQPGWRG
ncbi:hypothetical protein Q4511_06015 [Paracoccus sp. 1_MG-2023]|uniref:hypothetical protein n=1 Tax=unclassified Paracoccus (in: a-proteobacteria) TaxID=2688777 RepID=UPI001C07F999|nr:MULTISPECIES: hypothetical protein [unclassified Paracoccus (in: a-proteobacteria)]MBU2958542.1 hypothetical protein [Paracoccus sp. C2R09]MDO6668473.1 hypothetical protein [Paracoccus sp. 1_MG-2023]